MSSGYTQTDSFRARAYFRLPAIAEASKHIRDAINILNHELERTLTTTPRDEFADCMQALGAIDTTLSAHYHRLLTRDVLLLGDDGTTD